MRRSCFNALEKIEKGLRVVVIITFACFIALHTFLDQEPYHFYWSLADYLDGESLPAVPSLAADREGILILALDERSRLATPLVRINGNNIASFSSQTIMLRVRNGDLITIDGTDCDDTLTYRVIAVSPGVNWPQSNYCVHTRASSVLLGKVLIDD